MFVSINFSLIESRECVVSEGEKWEAAASSWCEGAGKIDSFI